MSYAHNTRKKNIKNQRTYTDPATGQEKVAVGGKRKRDEKNA